MRRRAFFHTTFASATIPLVGSSGYTAPPAPAAPINRPIANGFVTIWRSPDPTRTTGGPVSLTKTTTGRLVATFTVWSRSEDNQRDIHDEVYTSDDRGRTWTHRAELPFTRQRVFQSGDSLYICGGRDNLGISQSDDDGATWSEPTTLRSDGPWGGEPVNELHANGRIYLINEKKTVADQRGFPAAVYYSVTLNLMGTGASV